MSEHEIVPGFTIPSFIVESVDPQRMKTMAAILRDPYPVHWDPEAVDAAGLGYRTVNQGPLNLGYIANMLMAWAGDGSIRRLTVTFGKRVLDGDRVIATGTVAEVTATDDDELAICSVALLRDAEVLVSGTAVVSLLGIAESTPY